MDETTCSILIGLHCNAAVHEARVDRANLKLRITIKINLFFEEHAYDTQITNLLIISLHGRQVRSLYLKD